MENLIGTSFLRVCRCCLPKTVKICPCLSKLQLAKLGEFLLRHSAAKMKLLRNSVRLLEWMTFSGYSISVNCSASSSDDKLIMLMIITEQETTGMNAQCGYVVRYLRTDCKWKSYHGLICDYATIRFRAERLIKPRSARNDCMSR